MFRVTSKFLVEGEEEIGSIHVENISKVSRRFRMRRCHLGVRLHQRTEHPDNNPHRRLAIGGANCHWPQPGCPFQPCSFDIENPAWKLVHALNKLTKIIQ